jgi:hypothetical protein
MKTLTIIHSLSAVIILAGLAGSPAGAQQNTNTLAVGAIQPLPVLTEKFVAAGKAMSLRQVVGVMNEQLMDRLNATRKFKIMAGTDLKEIIKAQELANSGNYTLQDPNTAKQFQLAGIKWSLQTTLDDFEDQTERLADKPARTLTTKRTVRLGVTCKLFDTTTGGMLESASQVLNTNSIVETLLEASNNAEATDELLRRVTRDMAEWVAVRVANVAFPVKVLAKTDKMVTLNRGEGSGVAVGQLWNANAPGKELKDPDTGEVLGREEIPVGKIRITEVQPKFSKGEIIGEDLGVDIGAILRLPPPSKAP